MNYTVHGGKMLSLDLSGKRAILTGGSMGIGSAIALKLGEAGADVALNYRKHDTEAKAIVKQLEEMGRHGLAIQADVAVFDDAQKMVEQVVLLVCNAGVNSDAVIWKMT